MSVEPKVSRRFDPLTLVIGGYICVLSVFGGGNTVYGPPLNIMLIATVLFVGALFALLPALPKLPVATRLGLAAIVIIPLLQIVPLPPSVWQALPGSALRVSVLTLIGQADSWQPLSLEPMFTGQTFVLACGFVALFLGLMTIESSRFERMMQLLLGLISLGILIGVVQVSMRGSFPRFFSQVDAGALIGFFANKNHMALAIAASLPLAYVVLGTDPKKHPIRRIFFFAYWAVALVAILATTSRAGLALGLLASLALGLSMLRRLSLRHRLAIGGALVVIAVLVTSSATFQAMVARFDYIGDDNRWLFTLRSLPLVREYWVLGAGGGTFFDLFITSEPIDWVKPTVMNHVHDDYVELIIEYGIAGAVALALMLVGFSQSLISNARAGDGAARAVVLSGGLMVLLVLLHSFVDYPIRRPATLAIVAVALAMMARAPRRAKGSSSRRSRR